MIFAVALYYFAIHFELASVVNTHSWIACTDYVIKNDVHYDVNKCRGWPRAANKKLSRPFGQDTGFDYRPGNLAPCQTSRNDEEHYDADHPMAVYYAGQQVVLAHPMKNHGADAQCTNIYIPDNGNFIYRGPRNGGADPSLSELRKNLVFDLGRSPVGVRNIMSSTYPKPGYQNAPGFCENTDKSLGTYSFNVPRNLMPGRYTFIWLWSFNGINDLYSTCFEVQIVRSRMERNIKLEENGFSDLTDPCGGNTSNPFIRGNCDGAKTTVEFTGNGKEKGQPPVKKNDGIPSRKRNRQSMNNEKESPRTEVLKGSECGCLGLRFNFLLLLSLIVLYTIIDVTL